METIETMTNEKMQEIYTNIDFCKRVASAHNCYDKYSVFKYKKTCTYPVSYIVSEEQIEEAAKEYNRAKEEFVLNMKKNVLYFVGMGCNFKTSELSDVENYRIRAFFQNNKNELFFIEFSGSERELKFYCTFSISYKNGDLEDPSYNYAGIQNNQFQGYTKENILGIVNSHFNCNFEGIEIEKHFYITENISVSN